MKLSVEYVPIGSVKEYANNAKLHPAEQIQQIKESIKQFGDCDPIGVWHDPKKGEDVIVEGHGRYRALLEMGETEIPIIRLDHLTDEQRKAYALVHNKLTMNSDFDTDTLLGELDEILDIDMSEFGFLEDDTDWFENRERYDNDGDHGEEYQEFLDKFEAKRTTDDCYTPDRIYDTVANWVTSKYNVKAEDMVRPFYPGGDYQRFKYKANAVVVDNPPFSILSEIIGFYAEKGIKYFLFAPALTVFSSASSSSSCAITCGVVVTYENGAKVSTSFLTNLEDENMRARTEPELYQVLKQANDEEERQHRRELPKYQYPDQVVTAAQMNRYCKYGVDFSILKTESVKIGELDEQKECGKCIFGNGYLLAEKAAAEKAAAEKAAAEKAAAEKWSLSEREWEIVRSLG